MAGEGLIDEVQSVTGIVSAWPLGLPPLTSGPVDHGDSQAVPGRDEHEGECAGPKVSGWIVPDPQSRQARLSAVLELCLPLWRLDTGRQAAEASHLLLE